MSDIFFRRIGKLKLNSSAFMEEIQGEAILQAELTHIEFLRTVQTWRQRPRFYRRVLKTENGIVIQVITDDKVYNILDRGTRVRWALMTRGFIAKTAPGRVGAIAGSGRMFLRGKRAMAHWQMEHGMIEDESDVIPSPGIEARHFAKSVKASIGKRFRMDMKNAVARGTRRMVQH